MVHIHFEAGARDEKWLVLRTSIGCINKRQGSQATRDDSGKGISIHLSQRLHLLAGFATNPSHRNCIWEKMPRGMKGDISSLGHKGVPRVSATATTATTNARGLKGRFSWYHGETLGILILLLVLLPLLPQRGQRGFFLAPQGTPRASVSFPSIHPDPICYAMSSCMMQILRRHHVASHIFQSLHQLVSFRW